MRGRCRKRNAGNWTGICGRSWQVARVIGRGGRGPDARRVRGLWDARRVRGRSTSAEEEEEPRASEQKGGRDVMSHERGACPNWGLSEESVLDALWTDIWRTIRNDEALESRDKR